jgi:hypothetical protein
MSFEHEQAAGCLNGEHLSRNSPSKIREFLRYPFRTSRNFRTMIATSVFVLFVVGLVTVLSLTQSKTTDKHTDEHRFVFLLQFCLLLATLSKAEGLRPSNDNYFPFKISLCATHLEYIIIKLFS